MFESDKLWRRNYAARVYRGQVPFCSIFGSGFGNQLLLHFNKFRFPGFQKT